MSDITDCLNIQCFATTLYLYLVSLCSLVAFGALLSKYTGNEMVHIFLIKNHFFYNLTSNLLIRELLNVFYLVVYVGFFFLFFLVNH